MTGASAVSDGNYDLVSGTWTISAGEAFVGARRYTPRLTVETLENGEWVASSEKGCSAYTVDKAAIGDGRVRLTWKWAIPRGFILTVR